MEFTYKGDAKEVPKVEDLSNTERAMLRGLAEPGGPLWKIFRSMLDYGEGLREALVSVDLLVPEQVDKARKVQATIVAVDWMMETFRQALTDQKEAEKPHE